MQQRQHLQTNLVAHHIGHKIAAIGHKRGSAIGQVVFNLLSAHAQ